MSKQSEAVKRWRRNTKRRLIEAFGGKCCICGYNKCDDAFDFHHIDPKQKETSFSQYRGHIKAWNTIVTEMQKCVLLCCRCHREVHSGIAFLPDNAPRFNKQFLDYKQIRDDSRLMTPCPVCGTLKPSHYQACSKVCAGKQHRRIDWDSFELLKMKETMTSEQISNIIGCSPAAVTRQIKIQRGQ